MRSLRYLLVVVVLVAFSEVTWGDSEHVVDGVLNTKHLVLVVDHLYRLVESVPDELYISFEETVAHIDEYTPPPPGVDYRLVSSNTSWIKPFPPGSFYAWEIRGTVVVTPLEPRFTVSFNVTEHNNTLYAGVQISFSMKVRVIIVGIRRQIVGDLNIGSLILKYLLNNTLPEYYYNVTVEKRIGNSVTTETYSGVFKLNLSTAVVQVFTARMWLGGVTLTNYTITGNLSAGAWVEPVYTVTLCGEIPSDYGTTLLTLASIGTSEMLLILEPGSTVCNSTRVTLQPGYNKTVPVLVRSGMFTALLELRTHIFGLELVFPVPSAVVYKNASLWEVVVTVPVVVSGYYITYPILTMRAQAVHQVFGSIPCTPVTVNKNGTYYVSCRKSYGGDIEYEDVVGSKIYITLQYTDELGYKRVLSGEVVVTATDPTSIAGQAWLIYNYASNTLLLGAVMVIALMAISYLIEIISGRSLLFGIDVLRGVLLTLVVSAIIIRLVIPSALIGFSAIIANIPILRNYLGDLVGIDDPAVLFSRMVGYYDRLFNKIEADLNTYFMGSMNSIFANLIITTATAVALFITALALSTPLTPGGGTPIASIASTLFSFVFGVISILMAQVQLAAFVIVGLSVVRVLVFVVTALILVLTVVGVIMICIPTPTTQMIGEDLMSASIIFLLALPITAPVTYAIYMHVMETSTRYIRFPGFFPFIPVFGIMDPLARMIVYIISSSIALMMIVGTLAAVLTRTGVAVGIAEALSGFVLRG